MCNKKSLATFYWPLNSHYWLTATSFISDYTQKEGFDGFDGRVRIILVGERTLERPVWPKIAVID
jgi:hypothetical protein